MTDHGALDEFVVDERAYDDYIIDADFHLHIPTEKLYPYVEDPYVRDVLEEHGPPPFGRGQLAVKYSKARTTTEPHDRVHGIAANAEEVRAVCDELAIDVPVVQPGTNLELVRSNYPTLTNALTRAYNDYLLDNVIDVGNDVYATLMVPNWDVEFAVEELHRVGDEPGFVAAQNWLTLYKQWGDVDYDPIFEALTDLDLNLVLHVTSGDQMGGTSLTESSRAYTERLLGEWGSALIGNVANMVMTGVFDEYPDLQVSLQEAGTLWIPYVAYRLDELYQAYPHDVALGERLYRRDARELDRMPSEYVFDNTYAATQPIALPNVDRSAHVDALLTACRAGSMFMYTSDWPHVTVDPAEWLYTTAAVDDELRSRILHGNAEELLRLP
ncbi:MAG: amidohydrolase family protein [Haloferacaceae archaeon]